MEVSFRTNPAKWVWGGVGGSERFVTHPTTSLVVVQVHQRSWRVLSLLALLAGIDEGGGEGRAVGDVVGAPGPLEAILTATTHRPVAPALPQLTAAAGARDGVRHPGRRYGVHERRLSGF